MSQFSNPVQDWLDEQGVDITKMTLEELKEFKKVVIEAIDKDVLLDLSTKLLGNGAYGASSTPSFFFYNLGLASDITAESRETTHYMERRFDEFFHGEWWDRKDLHEKFGIKLDESKREWYNSLTFSIYGDTDSLYCCYGDLFETFTEDTRPKTDKDKLDWILRFNKEFLDKWNNEQLDLRFNTRHGKNIHEFELETVAKSGIFLAKKKYTQAIVFSKGNYYLDKPKVKGKGVELIKSQTPALARKILKELVDVLLNQYDKEHKAQFTMSFTQLLAQKKKQWMEAPIEEISLSANIGKYFDNVFEFKDLPPVQTGYKDWERIYFNDKFVGRPSATWNDYVRFSQGKFTKGYIPLYEGSEIDYNKMWWIKSSCGPATKGIARYNYMAERRGLSNLKQFSGKVKYYYISNKEGDSSMFSFPAGEYPDWAPACARNKQFQKCIIDPINRFCNAIGMQEMNVECRYEYSLFD